jgi:hypothetical protein
MLVSPSLTVCAALTVIAKLINAETIPALLTPVELLNHPKELVRKKAVLALHSFNMRAPSHVAPYLQRFRQMLCDKVTVRPKEAYVRRILPLNSWSTPDRDLHCKT